MERIYKLLDRIFDPLPKELRNKSDDAGAIFDYKAEDEGYKRHKYLCYRKLIMEALLAFSVGLLLPFLLHLT